MAKSNRSPAAQLPSVESKPADSVVTAGIDITKHGIHAVVEEVPQEAKFVEVILRLPILPPGPHDFISRQVNSKLSHQQALTMRSIANGINAEIPCVPGTSRSRDSAVVRYILEQITSQLDWAK